jgi:hypothetical protein
MKAVFKFLRRTAFLIGVASLCLSAQADTLRLRNGQVLSGQFMGATEMAIWFHSDTPDGTVAAAYPILFVESLTFGPAGRQTAGVEPGESRVSDPQTAEVKTPPAPPPTRRGKPSRVP